MKYPIIHTLGLTATPLKLQTNMGDDGRPFSKLVMLTNRSKKGNFFKKIIHVAQIDDMVENKFWSTLQYVSYDFNTGDLVYNTTGADQTIYLIIDGYGSSDQGHEDAVKNLNRVSKIIP